jgi:hypothetical protein
MDNGFARFRQMATNNGALMGAAHMGTASDAPSHKGLAKW